MMEEQYVRNVPFAPKRKPMVISPSNYFDESLMREFEKKVKDAGGDVTTYNSGKSAIAYFGGFGIHIWQTFDEAQDGYIGCRFVTEKALDDFIKALHHE